MAPKKRGRPAKAKVEVESAPIVVSDDEEAVDHQPPQKKVKGDVERYFSQSPVKKPTKDAQIAHTKGLTVPVDDGCILQSTHRVHIDAQGTIYDVSLNQTNIGGNNNKFYRIQILERKSVGGDFHTWTRWGRVGDRGQSNLSPCDTFASAFREFNKKFKDKTGHTWDDRHEAPKPKKYTFVERSYEPDSSSEDEVQPGASDSRRGSKQSIASDVPSKLELPVQHLMQLIFSAQYFKEVMAEMNYDVEKMPLGKLSRTTIEKGYGHLKALASIVLDVTSNHVGRKEQIDEYSSLYYSQIPHNFGRRIPTAISTEELLKSEIELLDSLSDMKIAEDIISEAKSKSGYDSDLHPVDRQYAGLKMSEMAPLSHKSTEYQELEAYLQGTRGSTHAIKYEVEDIFRIERAGEFDRFDTSSFGKMQADRRLLWHGSRATNFGGILSQGLRIAPPEAPVSGYMFGKGVYLADMSSKSANYCCYQTSGNTGLLLLCEAELGKPVLELTDADYDAGTRAKAAGAWSTWGKGRTAPKKWKNAGVVHEKLDGVQMPDVSTKPGASGVAGAYLEYNEYIAYDVNQIRMRYLFRVKMM